jgi:hypothetical protein
LKAHFLARPPSSSATLVPVLVEVNKLKGEIIAAQRMHALSLEQSQQSAGPFFLQGYGAEPRKLLANAREEAKAFLRPIAQLGAPRT